MTPMEHYHEAETFLALAKEWAGNVSYEVLDQIVARAQVHATLATTPDAQYRPESRGR